MRTALKHLKPFTNEAAGKAYPFHFTLIHYFAFLIIVNLGTYYIIIFRGDFISLDDTTLLHFLLNQPPLDLKRLFIPSGAVNYFRPVVELSYRLDYHLWLDIASGFYLTNVILHTLNALFVFLIARLLFQEAFVHKTVAAFLSALLFSLSPLVCEPVCWISGRSELLAAVFLLPSFALYVYFRQKTNYRYLMFAVLLYFFAIMAKEVALALPALVAAYEFLHRRKLSDSNERKILFIALGCFSLATIIYFFFRGTNADTTNVAVGVGPFGLRLVSPVEKTLLLFASVGFYIKKLFYPYPLNFAIHSIHLNLYAIVGVLLLAAFTVLSIFRRSTYLFFASWVLIACFPAVLAAVVNIPWVPWAERYLYLPLAGFSFGTGYWLISLKQRRRSAYVAVLLIIMTLWVTTLHRITIWADELKLWEDTARKSDYAPVLYLYGKTLVNRNRESEGRAQLEKAISKGYGYHPSLILANLKSNKGDYASAVDILKRVARDYPDKYEVHKYIAQLYLLMASESTSVKTSYQEAIEAYNRYLTVQKNDVEAALRVAVLYKKIGKDEKAVPLLDRILTHSPKSAYASSAARLLQEIRELKVAR